MTVEQRVDAAILGIAGLVLLIASPLAADGQQIVFWSDLSLVAMSVLVSIWVLRRPWTYEAATSTPAGAMVVSPRKVARRAAAWGVPYVLVALAAATANPDFFGLGFPCLVIGSALALEARNEARRQQSGSYRLYRGKRQGRFKASRPLYRRLETTGARQDV